MGIIDWIFGKKEEKKPEEVKESQLEDVNQEGYCNELCQICQEIIAMNRWKRIQGKFFHKKCYKMIINKARDGKVQ